MEEELIVKIPFSKVKITVDVSKLPTVDPRLLAKHKPPPGPITRAQLEIFDLPEKFVDQICHAEHDQDSDEDSLSLIASQMHEGTQLNVSVDDPPTPSDELFLMVSQQYESPSELSAVNFDDPPTSCDRLFLMASQQYESPSETSTELSAVNVDDPPTPYDGLFLMASQHYESSCEVAQVAPLPKQRFSLPVSTAVIQKVRKAGVPTKTASQSNWALKVWYEWAKQRLGQPFADSDESKRELCEDFCVMDKDSMEFWLPKFVLESRRKDGACYPPETLYSICTGLNRILKSVDRADINLFSDPKFISFKQTLDSLMKQLKATGNYHRKKAEVITLEHENLIWEKGLLGDHNARALVDTLVFYIGLYFAIRGGEHRLLRHYPSQLCVYEPVGKTPYIMFTEDVSKTNQGGLLHRKKDAKQVIHHANSANPQRCLVRLYKLYNAHCPKDRPDNAFYLKPLEKPRGDCWYTKSPIGHNTLGCSMQVSMSS